MYRVTRKFIGTNGHNYEVGDLVQRHVYEKFSRRHKSRCSYTVDAKETKRSEGIDAMHTSTSNAAGFKTPAPERAIQEESKPQKSEESKAEDNDENEDNTGNEIVAGAVGFGLGLLAGDLLSGNSDSPAPDSTPEFGGFGGGDGGGGGAEGTW